MVIQHNLPAMAAANANSRNVAGIKKRTEKLSTGYSINRAADNASGLAVSEKMRSQIRGLSQATNNANDSISLIQTAEGGLQETEIILQRMRELAVQSANGTYTDEDRAQLQHEADALKGEINRISESTEFNEMKLLSGEITVSKVDKVPTSDYGARYGSINYDLDIGGGKISVASSIQGMWLKFTTGASGKGGENAYYEYDTVRTQGELTQHITINLAEGQTYTDDDIQKLIDNANWPKGFETAPGRVMFKSEVGQIRAAEAETYGLLTGDQKQVLSADLKLIGSAATITPERVASSTTKNVDAISHVFNLNFDTTADEYSVSIDKGSGTITVGAAAEYATEQEAKAALSGIGYAISGELNKGTDYYANTVNGEPDGVEYVDANGNPVKANHKADINIIGFNSNNVSKNTVYQTDENGNEVTDEEGNKIVEREYYTLDPQALTVNVGRTQSVAYIYSNSSFSYTFSASQYGSYADYVRDEEKYKYPDAIDEYNMNALKEVQFVPVRNADEDVSVNIDTGAGSGHNTMYVSLKQGAAIKGADIQVKMQQALDEGGFKYSVDMKETLGTYSIYGAYRAISSTVEIRESGRYDGTFGVRDLTGYSNLTTPGHRSVRRVGTIAGVRQTAEADLTSLMIQPGSGTIGSSDRIKFTANTYGKAANYDLLVPEFTITTEQDLPAGKEYVDTSSGSAYIHLATGTKYTNESIEKLLKDAGLDYTVELTDSHSPDGDKDGEIYFNNTGSVRVHESVAGQGVGLEDIADMKEELEFQIGANGVEDQKVGMDIIDASASAIGVADIDISNQYDANKAIEKIDEAIKTVSTYRAEMGALQNRMEKSVNSLTTSNENLTDAESRIRDTDMAAEMIEYQKNNIIQQASQSMLAQANQQPNGILSLLG